MLCYINAFGRLSCKKKAEDRDVLHPNPCAMVCKSNRSLHNSFCLVVAPKEECGRIRAKSAKRLRVCIVPVPYNSRCPTERARALHIPTAALGVNPTARYQSVQSGSLKTVRNTAFDSARDALVVIPQRRRRALPDEKNTSPPTPMLDATLHIHRDGLASCTFFTTVSTT